MGVTLLWPEDCYILFLANASMYGNTRYSKGNVQFLELKSFVGVIENDVKSHKIAYYPFSQEKLPYHTNKQKKHHIQS